MRLEASLASTHPAPPQSLPCWLLLRLRGLVLNREYVGQSSQMAEGTEILPLWVLAGTWDRAYVLRASTAQHSDLGVNSKSGVPGEHLPPLTSVGQTSGEESLQGWD